MAAFLILLAFGRNLTPSKTRRRVAGTKRYHISKDEGASERVGGGRGITAVAVTGATHSEKVAALFLV